MPDWKHGYVAFNRQRVVHKPSIPIDRMLFLMVFETVLTSLVEYLKPIQVYEACHLKYFIHLISVLDAVVHRIQDAVPRMRFYTRSFNPLRLSGLAISYLLGYSKDRIAVDKAQIQ